MRQPPKIAPPSVLAGAWRLWLDELPARLLPGPWPFPVSAIDSGMVRNEPGKARRRRKAA